jgi:molybdate transport system ATP-binding protein
LIDIHLDKTLRSGDQSTDTSLHLHVQTVLKSGEFVALVGPSGAGKTTMLRMLAGLTEPDAGKIVVDGEVWFDAAKKISLAPQRRSIGFVFQDYALFPNLTVRQNVGYALGKHEKAWLDDLLGLTGLTTLHDRSPATLSGGQKQRVALARAIARKPKLLLLDEPLSALDIDLRVQLQEELARLQSRFGFTTVMVSHDLGEVFKLAQQVLRIDHGKIVQAGTPSQVFLSERHAGKLNLQAQVLEIRREEVIYVLSLLIGNDIVDVIASDDEVAGLKPGDLVSISAKAFSPLIFKRTLASGGVD